MFVYSDDLLVTSPNHRKHKKHLKILFTRLAEYGIIIGPEKCQFGTTKLSFLGHHVSAAGISPLPSAVDAIVNNFVRPEKLIILIKGKIETVSLDQVKPARNRYKETA